MESSPRALAARRKRPCCCVNGQRVTAGPAGRCHSIRASERICVSSMDPQPGCDSQTSFTFRQFFWTQTVKIHNTFPDFPENPTVNLKHAPSRTPPQHQLRVGKAIPVLFCFIAFLSVSLFFFFLGAHASFKNLHPVSAVSLLSFATLIIYFLWAVKISFSASFLSLWQRRSHQP